MILLVPDVTMTLFRQIRIVAYYYCTYLQSTYNQADSSCHRHNRHHSQYHSKRHRRMCWCSMCNHSNKTGHQYTLYPRKVARDWEVSVHNVLRDREKDDTDMKGFFLDKIVKNISLKARLYTISCHVAHGNIGHTNVMHFSPEVHLYPSAQHLS